MTEYFEPENFPVQGDTITEYFDPSGFPIQDNTITQHVEPTDSAQEQVMNEHFELAQGSRGSLPEAELDCHGRVLELRCAQPTESPIVADCTEFDGSKLMRLSSEFFPDLKGPQLKFLNDLCLAAHRSEEFFLTTARNQWVRTVISSDKATEELFSSASIVEEHSKLISSVTIHSNVLPSTPFWTNLQAIRASRDGTSNRVHFPCSILKEAIQEGNTLMKKLLEWKEKRTGFVFGQHGSKRFVDGNIKQGSLKLFWKIQARGEVEDDVKPLKQFAEGSDGTIWLVTWRGGMFVRKDRRRIPNKNDDSEPSDALDTELNVVEKLSHPHIIYSFGVSYAANKSSLFMEYMQNDLSHFIVDKVRMTEDDEPPFSHQDSVDILLQIAKAMAHTHEQNVIHGDLKSLNILVSEFLISEDVKYHLVKLADFGSAQIVCSNSGSTGFKPGAATTKYAAPEVLKWRSDKNVIISSPEKIDVYSFGIVAFEVLTGEEPHNDLSLTKVKKGVIDGSLRPPLRVECQKEKFLHDKRLISHIESCWHGDPSKRPTFSKIIEVLNSVRFQIVV